MTKQKEFSPGRGYTKKDWDVVSANQELTAEGLAKAQQFTEALPDLAAAVRRGRGPQKAPKKVQISLRLDPAAVEAFKATGDGWQIRIFVNFDENVPLFAVRKLQKLPRRRNARQLLSLF